MKAFDSIEELQNGLVWREYSVSEVVDSYLARIHAQNTDINAFITVTEDYAYNRARSLQKTLNDNPESIKEYPLLGVPIAVKDMYLTKDIRTTAASKVLADYVPQYSSSVFEKLEKAGAILIGKTNCDAWAHGSSGENSDFGPTRNPWSKDHVPGGSSSGSAAAMASDMSLVAMGTDTGGSIRLPASFCGIVGFKPTYGAVSRYGVISMASSLDSVGHFARTTKDVRMVFNVTKGEDGLDATLKNEKFVAKNTKTLGVPKEYFAEGLDREVKRKVEDAIRAFEDMGFKTEEVSLPHTKYAVAVYYIVQPAEVSSNLGRYDGVRYGEARDKFSREAKRRIMLGTYVLSSGYYDAYYDKAMRVRTLIKQDFDRVFEKVDAILAPSSPTPPFRLGEKTSDPMQMYLADIYTVSANLAGIPAISIPVGFTDLGLPVGMQILGPRFSEDILFKTGDMYQAKTTHHLARPI